MAKHRSHLPVTPLSVIGELLITFGFTLLLFVVWQVFINDPVVGAKQEQQAQTYVQTQNAAENTKIFNEARDGIAQGKVFGKLYIPRFGGNYQRLIGQGTFQKITLNKIGPGHYISSQWPGEVGNFAVAAHRTSHGAPFFKIDTLQTGDLVFVQTNESWFEYEYRQTAIVKPTDVSVIRRVPPGLTGAHAGGSYMTMTSCNPKWSATERIVVWLELVKTLPTSLGTPDDLINLQSNE